MTYVHHLQAADLIVAPATTVGEPELSAGDGPRYVIVVQEGGSDPEVELCRVGANPERIVNALRSRRRYSRVQIVERW